MSRFDRLYSKIIKEMSEETPFDGPWNPTDKTIASREAAGFKWNGSEFEPTPERQAKDAAKLQQRADMRDDAYVADIIEKFKQQTLAKIENSIIVEPSVFKKTQFKPGNYLMVCFSGFSVFRSFSPCCKYVLITPKLAAILNSGDEQLIKKTLWIPLINKLYEKEFKADISLDISDSLLEEKPYPFKMPKIRQLTPAAFEKAEGKDLLDLTYTADGHGIPLAVQ